MESTGLARTILGPLTTTTFTPAPACYTAIAQCDVPYCGLAYAAQSCVSTGEQDNRDCWPPRSGSITQTTHNPTLHGWGFYSPGVVCPPGYTSACTATGGGSWDWPVQYSIYIGETAVGCCPSFSCGNTGFQTCTSTVAPDGGTFAVATCGSSSNNPITATISTYQLPLTSTVPTTDDTGSTYTTVLSLTTYVVYAPLFQINWQSTDRPSSTSSSATTTTTSSSSSSSASSSGLSTGARAGLGVGIALAVIALIALVAFFVIRRRRRSSSSSSSSSRKANHEYHAPPGQTSPSLMGKDYYRGGPHELGSASNGGAHELPGDRAANGNVYELSERVPELHE